MTDRPLTFSVAMCTYNGARFVPEQLESIAAQSRPPEELVICDDGSRDGTVEILEGFRSRAPFPVHIHVNAENQGITENFAGAIARSSGDIIALADQDDVWKTHKLATMESVFLAAPAVGAVFSDADVVDEDLRPRDYRLWQAFGFGPREQGMVERGQALRMLMPRNLVTGATLAFRSRFVRLILPFPRGVDRIHDGWIALVVAAASDLAFIPEPLILYRQHGANQAGAGPPVERDFRESLDLARTYQADHYDMLAREFRLILERIEAHPEIPVNPRSIAELRAKICHCRARASLPEHRARRLPLAARELISGRYHRYSSGFRSVAKDLLLP